MKIISTIARRMAIGALALGATSLFAVPTLRISATGAGAFDVADQSIVVPIDLSPVAGSVLWAGPIGSFTVSINTGFTKPANGSATAAELHLNIDAISTSLAGPTTLNVQFSETDFGPLPIGSFRVDSSATLDVGLGNTVTTNAFFDAGNALFAPTTLLGTAVFGPGASSLNQFSGLVGDPSYSLTGQLILTHAAGTGRASSAEIHILQNVPDGGVTLSLLGVVMLGLAVLRRKTFIA